MMNHLALSLIGMNAGAVRYEMNEARSKFWDFNSQPERNSKATSEPSLVFFRVTSWIFRAEKRCTKPSKNHHKSLVAGVYTLRTESGG
jgi:hypothetical protein